MSELPVAPFERKLRAAGDGMRVSRRAPVVLRDSVQRLAERIGERAGRLAAARGKKYVEREDVRRAFLEVVLGIDAGE
ncbi:MAG: histone-like protein [Euryarchaeota archaeon]